MKLSGRGEFQIIDYLRRRSRSVPGLIRGIGDDCAVTAVEPGDVVLTTTDLLTESVHFRLDWTDLESLGRKAVSVNISDLAAMGAEARYLFLSLAVPDAFGIEDLDQLLGGILQACDIYGVALAGGDTCRSAGGLTLSVTAYGTAPKEGWIGRGGAVAGDLICLTGTIGDSALALQHLQSGSRPPQELLQRHFNPTARHTVGLELARRGVATAMIDISDGLLGDLEHILRASSVGAAIELQRLPLSKSFRIELASDPALIGLALAGGEDYELLFTASPEKEEAVRDVVAATGVAIQVVGRVEEKIAGLKVYGQDGEIELPSRTGYKHFPETA